MTRTRSPRSSSRQPATSARPAAAAPVTIENLQAMSAAELEARLQDAWDRLEAELAQRPAPARAAVVLSRLNAVEAGLAEAEAEAAPEPAEEARYGLTEAGWKQAYRQLAQRAAAVA
ncbi:MAG: hypothetical protein ACRDI2_06975 [Chloroflexota bacterium]